MNGAPQKLDPAAQLGPPRIAFSSGFVLELAFLLVAVIWARVFHVPLLNGHSLEGRSILIGTLGAVPPSLFFVWTLESKVQGWNAHRRLLEQWVGPLFSRWSLWQLALISGVAGIGEEALFRGAIQGSLANGVGVGLALLLSSLLFGAAHLVTWTYAVLATIIGAYLGLLWIWTGNLLAPMLTHGLYDFVALVYLLRIHEPKTSDTSSRLIVH